MEKMRLKMDQDIYYKPQPLGRFKPDRGIVSEDLGRTEFKTSSTIGRKISKRPQAHLPEKVESDDNGTSKDDLDVLSLDHSDSPSTKPLAAHKKSTTPQQSQEINPSSSRFRVKPRPNFGGAELPDKEEREVNSSTLKPYHYFNSSLTGKNMPLSNQLALQRSQQACSHENGHDNSPLDELNPNRAKPKNGKGKRDTEPFPMQDDCHCTKSESKSRSPKRARLNPAPFPMSLASPGRSPLKPLLSDSSTTSLPRDRDAGSKEDTTPVPHRFPLDILSTNSLQCALSDEDDENDELALTDNDCNILLAFGGPRPFPMSIPQFLPESIDEISGSKRPANDNDEERVNKRCRPSLEPNAFDAFSSLSLEGVSHVDQTLICPYCDEPWPTAPSPTLLCLLERTKRKSYTDPRPGNVLGLKAPLAVFIELCQRHRFEMTHLPLALERGWPTRLDFASLPKRIREFKRKLGRFIDHPNKSQFWRELRDNVKEVGRMKVVSVSGQYATFERTQPGYYGEQGSIIIHQTLYSLFPPDDIPLTCVDPLTPDQFLTRVLVPETAALLIREDMRLSTKEEALRVLDESKKYGLAMFPEQAQGEEAAEVGEQLARERAKERRRLLEERGEADGDVQRQVEREHRLASKSKGKDKGQRVAKRRGGKESESDADLRKEEQESRKSMRKAKLLAKPSDSREPMPNSRPKRCIGSRGVSMLDIPGKLTPRPLREKTREASVTPWRSKRSPSTSPDTQAKPTSRSSSLYKPSRKPISSPPRPPTQEVNQEEQWVFDLRNGSPSPDRDDVDFDEMIARYEGSARRELAKSDSDVVGMRNDSTPQPKPKQKPCRIVQRPILNDFSDSGGSTKAMPKRKPTLKQKAEKREGQGVGMSVPLGQTSRKKGRTIDKSAASDAEGVHTSSWLLDDISD